MNSHQQIRVLVFATRMSGYMLACLSSLSRKLGAEIVIVRRSPDANQAPFIFNDVATLRFLDRATLDRRQLIDLVQANSPNLILCFGWSDRDYLAAVQSRPAHCRAVITMDTQWLATARQFAGLAFGRLKLVPTFDAVWGAGQRQAHFARLLGFPALRIAEGLYAADRKNFDPIMSHHGGLPTKRLVFVGRYASEKGIDILWDAFMRHHDNQKSDLELWCFGTGPLASTAPEHPKIRHFGFRQPAELASLLRDGGVFILPSRHEPWGVVVQEFALAGFPLILSRAVGAGDHYLTCDNGILLDKVDTQSLLSAFKTVDTWSDDTMASFSQKSQKLGEWPSVEDWVENALHLLQADRT